MPVRSLNSSVLRWPDAPTVDGALRRWASNLAAEHPEVERIGYFGSYARGTWGVGSDVDVLIVVASSDEPFERRSSSFDATRLPVPADVLVYARSEWESLVGRVGFVQSAARDVVWVFQRDPA